MAGLATGFRVLFYIENVANLHRSLSHTDYCPQLSLHCRYSVSPSRLPTTNVPLFSGFLSCLSYRNSRLYFSTLDPQQRSLSLRLRLILWPTVGRPLRIGVWHRFGAHDQILIFFHLTITFFLLHVEHPFWREVGSVVCSAINCPSRAEPVTILYCLIRDSPNLEGQVTVFISPRNRVAQLYPRALGSRFITSYDSQSYGGGMRTHLHSGRLSARERERRKWGGGRERHYRLEGGVTET
jgi:hypothetical protein